MRLFRIGKNGIIMNLEIDFPNLLGKNYNIIKGDNYEHIPAVNLGIYGEVN